MKQLFVGMARVALSLTLVGLSFAAFAGQQTVDVSDLARCRAIAGAGERLACYDSLEARAVAGVPSAPAAAPTGTASSRAAATTSDSTPATPAGAATASGAPASGTAAAAARSTDLDDPANFGLSARQLKLTSKGPEQIKSVVSRMTQDRLSNVDLVLENGQTWRLIEPDPRVRPGDAVTIKRAALGSYLLVTPSRRSYRIERTD